MYHGNSNTGTIRSNMPLPLRFHSSHSRCLHGNSPVPQNSPGGPVGDGVTAPSLPPCNRMKHLQPLRVAWQGLPLWYIFVFHSCWACLRCICHLNRDLKCACIVGFGFLNLCRLP